MEDEVRDRQVMITNDIRGRLQKQKQTMPESPN